MRLDEPGLTAELLGTAKKSKVLENFLSVTIESINGAVLGVMMT